MRALVEIIDSAKDGDMPTHEECYWAMLVYNSMFIMEHREYNNVLLAEKPAPDFIRKMKAENSFNTYQNMLRKSPKEFMGPLNDPRNPEYQKFRKMGMKIVSKFINKEGKGND
ncbi:hypothetical protein [Pelosinus baikalensis]|uniref:Uncharacterized protein n=1 Tax=Pelosinus baikalensis TaxID=2892015 RepID=A0ABS8I040_9FIRM|nr:hypothetical protein [Pelosinus baikalensis]MCC5467649.1 hypothetical protein [Pelosinus baikalensis]